MKNALNTVPARKQALRGVRRLIVKLGTGVLTSSRGHLQKGQVLNLTRQIKKLRQSGVQVILVSSGAIGAGMARLGLKSRPADIHDLQACAAIGQNLLMHHYETAFSRLGLTVGQVLLTHGDFDDERRRDNARHTLLRLLKLRVIPVVNENDAISYAEIKFGDNDQLASQVHRLVRADATILLSTVDGFYRRHGKKQMLKTIRSITADLMRHAGGSGSERSTGGMKSKLLAARRVNAAGQPLVVASGRMKAVLPRILRGEEVGTIFLPKRRR